MKFTHSIQWNRCIATSRYGILADPPIPQGREPNWINGVNNWEEANAALSGPGWYGESGGSLADAVKRMLSPGYFKSWETFASTRWNNPKDIGNTEFLSLEYIHNVIHVSRDTACALQY